MDTAPNRVPFSRMRKNIARRMRESVTTKPHVTLFAKADGRSLMRLREKLAPVVREQSGLSLSYTPLLVKLVGMALQQFPAINGWVEEDAVVLCPTANVAVAVDSDNGLITLVLRSVESLPIVDLCRQFDDLVGRARQGRLKPQDVLDGTFTVTNLGPFGIGHFTPIINPPQIATLGLGKMEPGVTGALDGENWTVRPSIPLSLSFDHAAIDGVGGARFVKLLIGLIEEPERVEW